MKKTLVVVCLVLALGTMLLTAGGAKEAGTSGGKLKVALLLSSPATWPTMASIKSSATNICNIVFITFPLLESFHFG